jgi:hypothetical protein
MNSSVLLPGALGVALCSTLPASPAADSSPAHTAREPAVAGLFYPRDPATLARTIDGHLAAYEKGPDAGSSGEETEARIRARLKA